MKKEKIVEWKSVPKDRAEAILACAQADLASAPDDAPVDISIKISYKVPDPS